MKKSAFFAFLSFTLLTLFFPQKAQGQEATDSGRHDSPLNLIQEEANYYANPEFVQKSLPQELQSREEYQPLFGGLLVLDGLLPRADFYQEVALPHSFALDTGVTEPPKTGLEGLLQWLSARIADVTSFITGVNQKSVKETGFANFIRPQEKEFAGGEEVRDLSKFKNATRNLQESLFPNNISPAIPALPGEASGRLDFEIPYKDTSVVPTSGKRQEIVSMVRQIWPDSRVEELWDRVVQETQAAGINPSFALAIWIEESAASSPNVNAASSFGCFPQGDTNRQVTFERSLRCFIEFTRDEHPNNFVEWVRYFCGPKAVPICVNNPNFLRNFKIWYDRIVPPGSPGAAIPTPDRTSQ